MPNIRYVPLRKDGLCLAEQEVTKPKAGAATPAEIMGGVNHIWIIDRSGSMSYTLSRLIDDLLRKVEALPEGDAVTIGWFSTQGGEFRFPLKGYKVGKTADKAALTKILNSLRDTVGLTCFSEILTDLDTVLKELAPISSTYSLLFLTDGFPVVNNETKEREAIFKAIAAVSGRIQSALLVGYGSYYNRELMVNMAEKIGGSLIHSSDLPTFAQQFKTFVEETKDLGGKIQLRLDVGDVAQGGPFILVGRQITMLSEDDKGFVEVPLPRRGSAYVYGLMPSFPAGGREVKFEPDDETDRMTKAAYAAALMLNQKGKTDLAMEILGVLGDVKLVTEVSNAFTPDDFGKAETLLQRAAFTKTARFTGGRKVGCVADRDAFCVLDALDLILGDPNARFYPGHDAFSYKRIGAKGTDKPGYPDFKQDKTAPCELTNLTWNASRLNLSLQTMIPGTVNLLGDFATHGFSNPYPVKTIRNFTVIRDGLLNIEQLPLSMSEAVFVMLQKNGAVPGQKWADKVPVVVDLTKLPVMNRAIADGNTSAAALCTKLVRELEFESQIKTYKALLKELQPGGKPVESGPVSAAQAIYLATQGIKHGIFSKPSVAAPTSDYYMAKEFNVTAKGLAGFPPIKDVRDKLAKIEAYKKDPKGREPKITAGEEIILRVMESAPKDVKGLEKAIAGANASLRLLRNEIQRVKFAVVLGKRWFDELPDKNNPKFAHAGYEWSFVLREVRENL